MKIFAIVLLPFLLLSGCSALQTPKHYEGDKAGYLIGSLGIVKGSAKTPLYSIDFKHNSDENEKYSVSVQFENMFGDTIPDIADNKKESVVIARRLKPGKYTVTNWTATINGGNTMFHYRSKPDFKIEFEIAENQITNIGSLLFHNEWTKSFIGMTKPIRFSFRQKESIGDEKSIAKSKLTQLKAQRKQGKI